MQLSNNEIFLISTNIISVLSVPDSNKTWSAKPNNESLKSLFTVFRFVLHRIICEKVYIS